MGQHWAVTDVQQAPPVPPAPPAPPGPLGQSRVDYEVVKIRRGDRGTYLALAVLLLFAAAIIIGVLLLARWTRAQLDPPGDPGEEIVLALGDGATTADIAPDLEQAGIIANEAFFQWYLRIKGGVEFQAGEYTFQKNSAAWDVLDVLRAGPSAVAQAATIPVTFPEGLTVEEMAARLDETEGAPYGGDDFLAELVLGEHSSKYIPAPETLGDVVEPFEGVLFPETYFVLETSRPAELINQQIREFDAVLDELGYAAAPERVGLTPYEVVVIASLIEEEAKVDEDRAKISRVIHNRLQQGWPLGIDATVVYATDGDPQITQSDLEIDSPYNTRLHPGLPPTPIAAPGRKSLEAALNPEPGDWMYYVLTDPSGRHSFATTEGEFLEYKAQCEQLGLCNPESGG
jgi:UPF0755 protein